MGEKKRKGLGGLSPEKKKLLKQLIMQKAAEDLKRQQEKEAAEKKEYLEKIIPKLDVDGLNDADLEKKVRELYAIVCRLEEEKYDWEDKIRKQDYEINELSIKVNDIKGKFAKPMLKKVAKTETRLAKFDKDKLKKSGAFRAELKSTGKSKYALEEEQKEEKPDFREGLHKHEDKPEAEEDAEEGGEEEEPTKEEESEEESSEEESEEEEEEEEEE